MQVIALLLIGAGLAGSGADVRGAETSAAAALARQVDACRPHALVVSSEEISPATGESGIGFSVLNRGPICSLDGYPGVTFFKGDRVVPFTTKQGGGPYVTAEKPRRLLLPGGGLAYFKVGKYRCDGGLGYHATGVQVTLPASRLPLRVRLKDALPIYCRPSSVPGHDDPGNTINISPIAGSGAPLLP